MSGARKHSLRCSDYSASDIVACKACGLTYPVSVMPKTPSGFRFKCKPCLHAGSLAKYHEKRKRNPVFSLSKKYATKTLRSEAVEFFKAITDRPDEIASTSSEEYVASSCGMILKTFFSRSMFGLQKEEFSKGNLGVRGYYSVVDNGKSKYVHRFICEAFNGEIGETVNHINGIKTDNRASNLETATNKENTTHAKIFIKVKKKAYRHNTVGGKIWYSRISVNGRDIYLGSYFTQEEAAMAYDTAEKMYFPEYFEKYEPGESA